MRLLVILLGLLLAACGGKPRPLPVEETVDLERYTGTWHEIARLPQWFQRGCYNSTATYELREDGKLTVTNRCQRDGEESKAEGVARVADPKTNARLKVRFDNWFSRLLPSVAEGNYWIIHLDDSYQVVMIGEPEREYLWILARKPRLEEQRYQALVDKAQRLGFPVQELKRNRDLVPEGQGAS